MNNFMNQVGSGFAGSIPMMLLMGPAGAVAGFAAGLFGASSGIQGNPWAGVAGGAAMGGLAGMVTGNPMLGIISGGATAGILALIFGKNDEQQQTQQQYQQAPYYPQMPYYNGNATSLINFPGYQQPYPYCPPKPQPEPPQPPPNYGGKLSQEGEGKPVKYKTSGGWDVEINGSTITIKDPKGEHTVKHWGDPHEQVDGKTIKDWDEKTRTLILGDGTKITMNATDKNGVITDYSIYDGAEMIKIDPNGNKIKSVTFNPWERIMDDAKSADGETSYIGYNQKGQFVYRDIYTQNKDLGVTQCFKDLITPVDPKNPDPKETQKPDPFVPPPDWWISPQFYTA